MVCAPLRGLDAVWLTEVARLLPELFTEQPDLQRYESVTEYGQRQRFFEALERGILAAPQPFLLLIDDLQWCDREALEWLHFLLRFDSTVRLLIIGCARKEELPQTHPLRTLMLHLRNSMRVTELTLQPLDAAETAKLASKVANRELDMSHVMHLFQETEGYPLFVVEMVRASLGRVSSGPAQVDYPPRQSSPDEARTLPPRVHAVLAGRLQQLSVSAREFAEFAATIGCEFTLDLLITAGLADVDSTVCALDELWHKRIVREHGINSYDFTHDKLREVAYGEISAPQCRRLHHRVAQALEVMHVEGDLDSVSGQIASHYERAGTPLLSTCSSRGAARVCERGGDQSALAQFRVT